MDVAVVPAERGQLREIAQFITARNDDDAQHIGYVGTEFDDILDTIDDLYDGALFALGSAEGTLTGVLGVEWDLELGRTWLYGPWGDGADALYAALRPRIPAAAAEHELYCAAGNVLVAGFAGRHGFTATGGSVMYELTRERLADVPVETLPTLPAALADQFADLHATTFPRTTYDAEALAGRVPPPLVAVEGDRLCGYVVLRLTPQVGSGELDYLAVAEDARGRGVGRRLAAAAAHQAFADDRMRTLILNTGADNTAAHQMYENAGFRRGRAMRSFRTPAP